MIDDNKWTCEACTTKADYPKTFMNNGVQVKHEPKRGQFKNLKALQWNADGLNTKIAELNSFVKEHNVDLVLIQETKLTEKRPTPKLHGYTPVRADRPGAEFPGGGLLTYIKDDLAYRKIGEAKNGQVEVLSVSIQQQAKKWVDVTNIYVPPRAQDSDISWIPARETCVIAGDMNGHSPLWDGSQPADKMGESIVDMMINNNLTLCNNGSPTRTNRGTGGDSTPDITLMSSNLANKFSWTTVTDLGSDHLPILWEIKDNYKRQPKKLRRPRWKRNDVNWDGFREKVENKIKAGVKDLPFTERVKQFNDILTEAGRDFVGKVMPKARNTCMNPKVRALKKKRNLLRLEIQSKRKEWIEACKEAQQAMEDAREEAWVEYLEDLEFQADPAEMWRVIKSLSGTPESLAPNEALIIDGKAVTSNPKKADAFAAHYARVSKLTFTKEERDKNRMLKKKLRGEGNSNDEGCKDFEMKELESAISLMKKNGAPGKDDIPPAFLKNLGEEAMKELLDITNTSFKKALVPGVWRTAIIIPILKLGKPASEIESYRPISLTSCVVKLIERMVGSRLYYIAETKGWFTNTQAGFRKQQCTEDQILRIVQAVSDGFQNKPAKRTVMLMIDYSKAYDRVWKEDLLLEMLDIGVPLMLLKWIRAFLLDRKAQVLYNGAYSKKITLCQGLPQGSVLAPLLFLFYINSLSAYIQVEGVENALFADDASLWSQDTDLNKADRRVQMALDRVEEWSKRKKMTINFKKCEATLFSPSSNEAKWRPKIKLNGKTIEYNPSPKFIAIHLDGTLAFSEQVKYVVKKVQDRCKMLASLATKKWGWKKGNLRTVYITSMRSVLDYAGPAWQPWLSQTQLKKLETVQNKALRLVTGQYSSTPVEALRVEAGIESYTTHSKKLTAIAAEKADRLLPDHPKYKALSPTKDVPHRSKLRSSWREEAKSIRQNMPTESLVKKVIPSPFVKPWTDEDGEDSKGRNWTVFTDIPDRVIEYESGPNWDVTPWGTSIDKYRELSGDKAKAEKVVRILDDYKIDTTLYTDGSCTAGTEEGGAAVIVTTGSARNPVVLETIKKKGGKYTCSFEEEKVAMLEAVQWVKTNQKYGDTIICSDSRSLLQSIEMESPVTADICEILRSVHGHTYIHWVPSHINIIGNELADCAAKQAAKLPGGDNVPISYETARALMKRVIQDPKPEHAVVKESYQHYSKRKDHNISSRKDAALLAQLRSGHCLELAHYQHRIDPTKSPTCPHCNIEEETVKHWISCPTTSTIRQQTFGEPDVSLGVLSDKPDDSITYAKITFNILS